MAAEQPQSFTIVILPERGGRSRQIRLTPRRLKQLLYAVMIVGGFVVLTSGFAVYQLVQLPARWRMEEDMLAQKLELDRLSMQLSAAETTIDRVERLDRKLRVILGEGVGTSDQALLGMGGPTPEAERFAAIADADNRIEFQRLAFETADLHDTARAQEIRLHDLQAILADETTRLASTPSIWPARGWVTSDFGVRTSPFTGDQKMHEGIDIATRIGNPVVATADGVVLFAGVQPGYGKLVIVDHGYGITTRYGHLSKVEARPGAVVTRGTLVGRVGNTGLSTGPHLHYEVRMSGAPINPYRYILIDDPV